MMIIIHLIYYATQTKSAVSYPIKKFLQRVTGKLKSSCRQVGYVPYNGFYGRFGS